MTVVQRRRRKEQPQRLVRLSAHHTLTRGVVVAWDGGYDHARRRYVAPAAGRMTLGRMGHALLADGTGYVSLGVLTIPVAGPAALMAAVDVNLLTYTNNPSGADPNTGVVMAIADRTELSASRDRAAGPYPAFTTSSAAGTWSEIGLSSSFGVNVYGPGTLRMLGSNDGYNTTNIYARDQAGAQGYTTAWTGVRSYGQFDLRIGVAEVVNRSLRGRISTAWAWTADVLRSDARNALRGEHLRAYSARRRLVTQRSISSVSTPLTAGYGVRGARTADRAATYTIAGATTADAAASYGIRAAVSAERPAAYAIVGALARELAAAFAVSGRASRDLQAGYSVRAAAAADLSSAYGIQAAAAVSTSLAAGYAVLGAAVAELPAAYALRAAVERPANAAYGIRGATAAALPAAWYVHAPALAELPATWYVHAPALADLPAQYALQARLQRDLAASYAVRGAAGGDCPSAAQIAAAVLAAMVDGIALGQLLSELHQIHGLRAGAPLIVADAQRSAGAIRQTFSGDGTSTSVARV